MTNEENKENYCVAVIFKNGMKITSKLTTKRKANQCYFAKRSEFISNYKPYMELEDKIFKIEDIFMICILPKKYRKWLKRREKND